MLKLEQALPRILRASRKNKCCDSSLLTREFKCDSLQGYARKSGLITREELAKKEMAKKSKKNEIAKAKREKRLAKSKEIRMEKQRNKWCKIYLDRFTHLCKQAANNGNTLDKTGIAVAIGITDKQALQLVNRLRDAGYVIPSSRYKDGVAEYKFLPKNAPDTEMR